MKRLLTCVLISMLILSTTGCNFFGHSGNNSTAPGGDPGGSDGPTGDLEGFFIDSGVAGLTYTASPSGITGTTDADGRYEYNAGDTVTFSIGSIILGSSSGAHYITPMTFNPDDEEMGVRIAQMLQSMDSDKNPDNGITPDPAAIEALKDIDLTSDSFETYLRDNLPANLTFVERDAAMNHMETTFNTYAINPNGHDHTIPKIFPGYDSEHGLELWLTKDGKKLEFVKELDNGGTLSSVPKNFVKAGDKIFFVADTPQYGAELWVTDGTDEGTHMVKDIIEGVADTDIDNLTAFGDKVIFRAGFNYQIQEPWISDGTADGTFMLKDINEGPDSGSGNGDFVAYNGRVYFRAYTATEGSEVWSTDGTTAGTEILIDYTPGNEISTVFNLKVADDRLWFFTGSYNNYVLIKSDGTVAGTEAVETGLSSTYSAVFKDRLYYASGGYLNYVTKDSKTQVTTVSSASDLTPGETVMYLKAHGSGSSLTIHVTDGEVGGYLTEVSDGSHIVYSPEDMKMIGDTLFFGTNIGSGEGNELFKTDGATFSLVKDIFPGTQSSSPSSMVAMGNKLYFTASTDTEGNELWVSDGTEAGTHIVKDINTTTYTLDDNVYPNGSSIYSLTVIGNKLYFRATQNEDKELWTSDGTEAGTELYVDANKEPASGLYATSNIQMIGDKYIFQKGDDVWVSDGTAEGTAATGETSYNLDVNADMGDYKIVVLSDWQFHKIMKTDGTLKGTSIIEDFYGMNEEYLSVTGGKLFFVGTQASGGTEKLYVSDGTENSAEPFLDEDSNEIENIAILAGTDDMMLIRTESNNGTEYTHKMYVSDGTSAGTKVIAETTTEDEYNTYYSGFLFTDGIGYYINITTEDGLELWSTDGTTAGTVLVKHIADASENVYFSSITNVDNTVYYVISNGESQSLWRTEGTPESTELVKTVEIMTKDKKQEHITLTAVIGDKLYFTTTDDTDMENPVVKAWVIHNKTGMLQELKLEGLDFSDYTLAIPYGKTNGITRGEEYMLAWVIDKTYNSGLLVKFLGSSATVIQEADFIDIGEDD